MQALLAKTNPYFGYLALAGLVGAAAQFLVRQQLNWIGWVLLGVGLLALIAWAVGNPQAIRKAVGARETRYGSNTVAMVLIFAAVIGVVNFIVAQRNQTWDVTATQQFTISQQTINLLKGIKDPITIKAFFSEQAYNKKQAQDTLNSYTRYTDKLSVQWIDPVRDPNAAMQYNLTSDGTTFFELGSKRQSTLGVGESDFTGTLMKLLSTEQKTVYFLKGHKERALDGSDQNGYSQLKAALEQNNYKTDTVDLSTNPTLTIQSTVLVIASPQSDLLPDEQKALTSYLEQSGKALFLGDPRSLPSVNEVLKPYGVTLEDGFVIDPVNYVAQLGPTVPIIPDRQGADSANPVTKDLGRILLPASASVTIAEDAPSEETITPMLQTTTQSWLVRPSTRTDGQFNAASDLRGPLNIGALVQAPIKSGDNADNKKNTRIAVVGNSLFATNQFLMTIEGNRDLFVNTVNWLSESEDMIAIGPKPMDTRQIFLMPSDMNLVFWSSVVFLPAVVLAIGGIIWYRRR
ncbi:MAG: hypothetical protein EPO21_08775 [Chloroflexota bacterium]|nr:MAG: hypothetical protein EPO21_08775 [Chloroflexota bacterium]